MPKLPRKTRKRFKLHLPSDDKKVARLNCIADILSCIPYEEVSYKPPKLQDRQKSRGYDTPRRPTRPLAQRW